QEIWPLVSSVLLLFLSASNLLTYYAGIANTKLAAYVMVFHESTGDDAACYGWEGRLKRLKAKELDPQNVNIWIMTIYFALAVLSVAVPFAEANHPFTRIGVRTFLPVSGVLFLVSAFFVLRFSYPRERYEKNWREVQRDEKGLPNR